MSTLQKFNQTLAHPKTQAHIQEALGEKKQSFIANATTLVANSQALQQCEPVSVMYAAMKATTLDLPLDNNLGFAYVIPFKDNKSGVTNAQFQIGYKGFIQLAIRSGQFKNINVRDVKEGELIDEDFLSGEMQFKKLQTDREQAKTIGYMAFIRLVNGFEKTSYCTMEEIQAHAKKYSQTYRRGFGIWKDNFDAMAKKTVLKLLLSSYAPMSVEQIQTAVQSDQAVFTAVQSDQAVFTAENQMVYVDNLQTEEPQSDREQNQKAVEILETAFNSIEN